MDRASSQTVPQTEIEAALVRSLPLLRRPQIIGFGLLVALAGFCVTGLFLLNMTDSAPVLNVVLVGSFGVILAILIEHFVRRQHSEIILPIVMTTFGLEYEKRSTTFLDGLPDRIPPRSRITTINDALSGTLAGRRWRFAEVMTSKPTRNTTQTIFDGAVIAVESGRPLPRFTLARTRDATASFLSGPAVVDVGTKPMVAGDLDGPLAGFSLWVAQPTEAEGAALVRLCSEIAGPISRFGPEAELRMIASDGPCIVVAITDHHDLFRIGGLFATSASVLADIRRVAQEVGPVIDLAAGILQAEAAMGATVPEDAPLPRPG